MGKIVVKRRLRPHLQWWGLLLIGSGFIVYSEIENIVISAITILAGSVLCWLGCQEEDLKNDLNMEYYNE